MRTPRLASLIGILLLATAVCGATTISFNLKPQGTTIGPEAQYAAIGGSLSINDVTKMLNASLTFDYGASSLNTPFVDTSTPGQQVAVQPGDLLFYVGGLQFGIPVADHYNLPGNSNNVTLHAGHLYENQQFMGVTKDPFLTAQDVLGLNPIAWPYRPADPVWLGVAPSDLASLTETVNSHAITIGGVSGYQYTVTLTGVLPQPFLNDVDTATANGTFSASFAAATCANGVLQGSPPKTPEPGSWLLLASGSLAMLLGPLWNHFSPLLCRPAKAMN